MGIFNMLVEHHKKNKVRSQNFDLFKACIAAGALIAMADDLKLVLVDLTVGLHHRCRDHQQRHRPIGVFLDRRDRVHGFGAAVIGIALDLLHELLKELLAMGGLIDLQLIDGPQHGVERRLLPSHHIVIGQIGDMLGIDSNTVEALKIDIKDEIFRV